MYLVENMIKRGLSLEDILKIIEEKNLLFKKEDIVRELEKERGIAVKDEALQELFKLLKAQSRVEGETFKLNREYVIGEREGRKGYLPIWHMEPNINENDYIFLFLCNRLRRVKGIEFEEYNKEFLKYEAKKVKRKLNKHKEKDILGPDIELEEVFDNNKNNFITRKKPKKIEKNTSTNEERAKDSDINKIINQMSENARRYKEEKWNREI